MNSVRLAAVLTLLSIAPIASRADGLLDKLPKDGEWVRFDLTGKGTKEGGKVEEHTTGTITLSSVGTEEVDGQQCRWIEVSVNLKNDDQRILCTDKLLIPEKYVANGEHPGKHVLKAWHWDRSVARGVPEEKTDFSFRGKVRLNTYMKLFVLNALTAAPRKLDKTMVDSKFGKLECDGLSIHEAGKMGDCFFDVTYTVWHLPRAPFGVNALELKTEIKNADGSTDSGSDRLVLCDFGDEAKSVIPDSK